jgi:hypothetical protein
MVPLSNNDQTPAQLPKSRKVHIERIRENDKNQLYEHRSLQS